METFKRILSEVHSRIPSTCSGYHLTAIKSSTAGGYCHKNGATECNQVFFFSELAPNNNPPYEVKPILGIQYASFQNGFNIAIAKVLCAPGITYCTEEIAKYCNGTLTLSPLEDGDYVEVYENESDYISKIADHILKAFKTMVK